jgi:ribosome-associated heat shock protein Hsp15
MRLDRFLFFIRLVKSRTLAQGLIEAGTVRVDGKRVLKTSEEVRIGSVIAFPLQGKVRIIKAVAMPTHRGPASEARTCYEELGEQGDSANVSQQGRAD